MDKRVRIRDGRYELLEVAGRGGMAVVWRATQHGDVGFERTVAVKQMHDHLSESQLYIDMFAEEARVCATMQNPNMAQVYDFVCEDGDYYLIMEWIDGIDLGSLIRHFTEQGNRMPWDICAAIGVGVLRALAGVHEREDSEGNCCPVLHRDISPHNILITTRGMVKLIDFGLCLASDRKTEMTEPGVVKGKMSYLSPEVVQGREPTARSDQFSVGSVLWESLAGRKLFEGETDFDVYAKIRDGQIAPIRPLRRDLPKSMISVLQKSLAPDPDNRFSSVRAMGRELSSVLKTARSSKDLHGLIGKTVCDARAHLDMGERTGEQSNLTPIADAQPAVDSVNLPLAGRQRSRAGTAPIPLPKLEKEPLSASKFDDQPQRKGLLHRLPFWGKKK